MTKLSPQTKNYSIHAEFGEARSDEKRIRMAENHRNLLPAKSTPWTSVTDMREGIPPEGMTIALALLLQAHFQLTFPRKAKV
ncbi:MAG TPA: hypothetical protein PKM25_05315 [Candidatus Ozemobacteraceae bacterium]|nr:hypothetical protein [Candidatus Ozemobacteraceae bacterium]